MDVEKCEIDTEKKTRRSSILKPQKPRNPFSTLDFAEATPDNTMGRASRRVSFASSNFVKPFAADPEKNTIWDNTYEEEINHTDSTKSSNEQTREAKSHDISNLTYIYSPESDEGCLSDSSPDKISTKCIAKDNINPILYGEILNMTLSNNKFTKPEVSNKDKKNINSIGHNISLISPLNATLDISSYNNTNIHMKNTIDVTNIVNKENVNPIINDISLVAETKNSLQRNTKLKVNDITKNTIVKPKTVSSEENVDNKHHQEVTRSKCGEQTVISQCDMELTTALSMTNIKENIFEETVTNVKNKTNYIVEDMEITETLDIKSKTIYLDKRDNDPDFTHLKCEKESDMEFTCVTENTNTNANDDHSYQAGAKMEITSNLLGTTNKLQESTKKIKGKNETICFNGSKGDMEFTGNLQVQTMLSETNNDFKLNKSGPHKSQQTILSAAIVDNQLEDDTKLISTSCKENAPFKKSDNFDQSKNEMKCQPSIVNHNNLKVASQDSLKLPNSFPVENKVNQLHPNESEMEFTANLPIENNALKERSANAQVLQQDTNSRRKTVYFNESEDDMEMTAASFQRDTNEEMFGNKMDSKSKNTVHFSQFEGDMELTETLPLKQNENIVEKMAQTTEAIDCNRSRENVDFTCSLSLKKCNDEENNYCINQPQSIAINLPVTYNEKKYIGSEKQTIPLDQAVADKANMSYILSKHGDKSDILQLNELVNNNVNISTKGLEKHVETLSCSVTNKGEHSSEKSSCIADALMAVKENHDIMEAVDESGNPSNMKKIAIGIKRHSEYGNDEDAVQRKICHIDQSAQDLSCETVEKISTIDNALAVTENAPNIETVSNKVDSNFTKEQITLQPSTFSNGNILYSEPMKIKLKTNDFPPTDLPTSLNLQNLDDTLSLKLNPVSTPFTSFRINLTDMSPCIEDTQQLIHATFSKPEFNALALNKDNISNKHSFSSLGTEICNVSSKTVENLGNIPHQVINSQTYTKADETTVLKNNLSPLANPKKELSSLLPTDLILQDTKQINDDKFLIIVNELPQSKDLETDRHYSLDLTPPDLVPSDDFSLVDSLANQTEVNAKLTPEKRSMSEQYRSPKNTSTGSPNHNNSTLRSNLVLTNVKEYLIHYKVEKNDHTKLNAMVKQCEENQILIEDLINKLKLRMSKMHIVDLKEKYKEVFEERSSSESETSINLEEEKIPSMAGLVGPKSLCERVSGAAERCNKHWKFHKMEDDYYYISTLFETLPFKVHVHPDLGIVYSIETDTNLEAFCEPLCWYQLKLFQHKLKRENLLPVLGANFDILSLLDYVTMTMEELIDFHTEYLDLEKRLGRSHHFTMNQDFSIQFEVLNVELIIWWIISVNLSLTSSVGKDDIKAVSRLGEPVNEEDIKCIAENTPKGPKFFSNFVENVDEYVKRIGKRIKFRRGHQLLKNNC